MGLKLSNKQLRLVTQAVYTAWEQDKSLELSEVLNRLVDMARHRGVTFAMHTDAPDPNGMKELAASIEAEVPKRGKYKHEAPQQQQDVVGVDHPLLRGTSSS